MINQKAISYAQPSVIKVGGIYEMYKIIQNCEMSNVQVMPHSAYFGPGFLATLQLAALMKKDTYIERFYLDIEQEFYPGFKKTLNGMYKLPTGPGLGMDFDYKKLSKYEI
jgi:L-alanine-DL-glutamate epimerase-like enolase superfamily enzyme